MKKLFLVLCLALVLLAGCSNVKAEASERQRIIDFTNNVTVIEAKRLSLLRTYTPYEKFVFEKTLPELISQMTWVECPNSTRDIKDNLLKALILENEACESGNALYSTNYTNYLEREKISSIRLNSRTWLMAQRLRAESYQHLDLILQQNDIVLSGFPLR